MSETFINSVRQIVLNNIEDEQFGVDELSREIGLSRYQLYRKIKKSTDKSISKFIQQVRLEKAFELLEKEELSISEIAYMVGFSSPSYFNRSFKLLYGCAPGELKKNRLDGDSSKSATLETKEYEPAVNQKQSVVVQEQSQKSRIKKPLLAIGGVVLIAILTVLFIIGNKLPVFMTAGEKSAVKYFNILLPKEYPVSFLNTAQELTGQTAFDISDDGQSIVYVSEYKGKVQLVLRFLNSEEVKVLKGTEGAYSPFFSPDGKWVAYFKHDEKFMGSLNKISIESGISVKLCDVSHPFGGDWGKKGNIVFADKQGANIRIISESGGESRDVKLFRGKKEYAVWITYPKFLPGESSIVASGGQIVSVNLNDGNVTYLNETGNNVQYVPTGHLVFVKDSKLFACPFDSKNNLITGSSIPFFTGIRTEPLKSPGQYCVSRNGTLVYAKGAQTNRTSFVWVNRQGEQIDSLSLPPDNYGSFSIAPSGKILSYMLGSNVWIYNLDTKYNRKIAAKRVAKASFLNSDGTKVAFQSKKGELHVISIFSLTADNQTQTVFESDNVITLNDWSPDNKFLGIHSNQDIFIYSFERDSVYELLNSEFFESQIDFAPDAKYFVYMTDENGFLEIFVQPFPATGAKWNVSNGYGWDPIWSFDGEEIFFRRNNKFFSVSVSRDSSIAFAESQLLFSNKLFYDAPLKSFAVSPDRNKLLVLKMENTVNESREITILENWFDDLQ